MPHVSVQNHTTCPTMPERVRSMLPTGNLLLHAEWQRRHQVLLFVLLAHVVTLPAFSLLQGSPLLHSLAEGLILAAFYVVALATRGRRHATSGAVTLGLLTSSALLVHMTGGLIEAHFHFFVIMTLVALYEDWLLFALFFVYVLAHHGIMGMFAPDSVYNHAGAIAGPWQWAGIHALFVVGASIGSLVCWRLNEDLRRQKQVAYERAVASEDELRIANQELRLLDDLKNEFISMASHELRTPLTSIGALSSIMDTRWDEIPNEQKHRHVGTIASQSRRLALLVDDLLQISAIESGVLENVPGVLPVAEVCAAAVAELPDNDFEVRCPGELSVFADSGQLLQVFVNLLSNAVKYGAGPIVLEARRLADGSVECRVSDCGDGVAADFVPRLFDRWSQASMGDRRVSKGTGLGLAIVKSLVEVNHGSVWYEPNEPHGSVFVVRLPGSASGALAA